MEPSQTEVQEPTASPVHDVPPPTRAPIAEPAPPAVLPQACPTCGTAPAANLPNAAAPPSPSYVYAIGRIEPRFPSLSVEKEFAQATGRADTKGLTDRRALQAVLSKPENRYLVRQLCFVMTIEGLETYILVPRDPADYSLLVNALRPTPQPWDLDLVIGLKGPVAPPTMCNSLTVPVVVFDQIYPFDRETLIRAIPKPENTSDKDFESAAGELLDRILQMTDNAGATDANRALNYLAVRYPAIYHRTAEQFGQNGSLTRVHVQSSQLSGVRKILDVIFAYTDRTTAVVDRWSVRVDVTDEFPFLVSQLSPYYAS